MVLLEWYQNFCSSRDHRMFIFSSRKYTIEKIYILQRINFFDKCNSCPRARRFQKISQKLFAVVNFFAQCKNFSHHTKFFSTHTKFFHTTQNFFHCNKIFSHHTKFFCSRKKFFTPRKIFFAHAKKFSPPQNFFAHAKNFYTTNKIFSAHAKIFTTTPRPPQKFLRCLLR